MDRGFSVIADSGTRDPDGSRLRGALAAQFGYERARSLRTLLVGLLAALGVPVWITAAWPLGVAGDFRRLAITLWLICFAALLGALGAEWKWHRRRASFIVDG